jgi:hypothetical protein
VPYDKNFITANSLRTRYESIIDDLLSGFNLSGFNFYLDSANFVRTSGYFSAPQTAAVLLQDFFNLLLIKTPTGDRYNYFMDALLNEQTALNWYFVWQLYIITGNPSDARNYLNRLISALVKSPEYQIM